MLQNYFKIALRNLLKNKTNTFINVTGLSIGMTCCILIVLYVADELNFDRFWPQGERIYRMALERKYPDRSTKYAIIPPSYAQSVSKEIPEIEQTVRVFNFNGQGATLIRHNDKTLEEKGFIFADSTFFQVFQIPLVEGTPTKVLSRPNTVVLTQRTARRLFGAANPIGKTLELVQGQKLEISGICADVPANGHFAFDFLASTVSLRQVEQLNHISFAAYTYLLLKPHTQAATVEAKLPKVVEKYAAGEVERNFGVSYKDYIKAGNGYFYFLQPIRDIHLDSNLEAEFQPNGNRTLVYLFSVIALFILLIACINFMNLATARSSERAREVGVRKAMGSTKGQLAAQFLTESVMLSVFSFLVSVGLVALFLPYFNNLANKQLTLRYFLDWSLLPVLPALAIFVGLLAGSYPAGVLSAFEPIKVLKGKFLSTRQGYLLRNGLVVFQFSISIILIIGTIIVYRQLQYLQDKELGFAKESVINLKGAGFLGNKTETFKREIEQLSGVESVGGANATLGDRQAYFGITFRKDGDNESVTGRGTLVDDRYLQTMRMTMLAGRPFERTFNDSTSVILNEEAVTKLGLTDPIGKKIISPDNFAQQDGPPVFYTVVGVVKNFHFSSLHERIVPLFVLNDRLVGRFNNDIIVRFKTTNSKPLVSQMETIWKRYQPDQPFHYSFLDTDLEALYKTEQVSQRIFGVFSLLAIFIACMGLLGLAIYVIQQRTKEIGVRKVLGASVISITALLSQDFIKLVLIAMLIASPIAWYAVDRWLQNFAYRIDIEWWVFVVAGVLSMGIAVLTVSFQSIKAALMNPVKSLKSE
ncbi:ABC transporter permease [Runella sp.]|uniref:ABC transporter permease n=1 Tax=Runella sp. TaxID=1960881 RepID=UPI003D105DD1